MFRTTSSICELSIYIPVPRLPSVSFSFSSYLIGNYGNQVRFVVRINSESLVIVANHQGSCLEGLLVCPSASALYLTIARPLTLKARGSSGAGGAESLGGLLEGVGTGGAGSLSPGLDVASHGTEDVGVKNLGTSSSGEEDC
jgi:hypothetical protein